MELGINSLVPRNAGKPIGTISGYGVSVTRTKNSFDIILVILTLHKKVSTIWPS